VVSPHKRRLICFCRWRGALTVIDVFTHCSVFRNSELKLHQDKSTLSKLKQSKGATFVVVEADANLKLVGWRLF